MTGEVPLLEIGDVSLSFPGVRALNHVSFGVNRHGGAKREHVGEQDRADGGERKWAG